MADKTKIEWTDSTWNAIRGCSRVSDGCRNCYAESMAGRFNKEGQWGHLLTTEKDGRRHWTGKVVLDEQALLKPLRWRRPRRVFVTSVSDPFHPSVTDEMLDRIFAVMALAPQHTFQMLTKRPERMREYLAGCEARVAEWTVTYAANTGPNGDTPRAHPPLRMGPFTGNTVMDLPRPIGFETWPLPNVWLGVSVEDQRAADERIPHLLATSAAVRFISAEPLLGPVDLENVIHPSWRPPADDPHPEYWPTVAYDVTRGHIKGPDDIGQPKIDWVIVGGESGSKARPMHPDWARSLRDQCADAGVPFLFKQWGAWTATYDRDAEDPDWRRCPTARNNNERYLNLAGGHGFHGDRVVFVRRSSKKAAGRLLDGAEHNAFPETHHGHR